MHGLPSWAPVLVAILTSVLLTSGLIRVCNRRGWLVYPREERWSRRAVARFGGAAILLSFGLAAFVLPLNHHLRVIVLLTIAMGLLGGLDDIFELPARLKLIGQTAIAVLAVWSGIGHPLFSGFLANFLFVTFFLVAVTNAFNLLDNMDGLAAGVGVIAAVNLVLITRGQPVSALILVMAGALLGFLVFNFNPAKIFMGDMGSLAIGFFLACATIMIAGRVTTLFAVVSVPGLVLFLPLFDMFLVSITRRLKGRAISAGAKDHTSHRLVMLGMSERRAVLTLYFIAAISGLVALLCKRFGAGAGLGILAVFVLVASLFWLYLAELQLPEGWLSRTNVFTLLLPETLNSLARRSAIVFTDIALLVLSLYLAFLLRFDRISPQYLASFLWASVLAIGLKIPLLSLFGVYRRDWKIRTLSDIYPIAKSSILGSLIMVAVLTYFVAFKNFSRVALGVDAFLSIALMVSVRVAGRFFDDVLTTFPSESYLVVGGASAEFYYRYFEWQKSHANIVAFVDSSKSATGLLYGVPVIPLTGVGGLLSKKPINAIFVLPDCSAQACDSMLQLAAQHGIPVHAFRFSMDTLSAVSSTHLSPPTEESTSSASVA